MGTTQRSCLWVMVVGLTIFSGIQFFGNKKLVEQALEVDRQHTALHRQAKEDQSIQAKLNADAAILQENNAHFVRVLTSDVSNLTHRLREIEERLAHKPEAAPVGLTKEDHPGIEAAEAKLFATSNEHYERFLAWHQEFFPSVRADKPMSPEQLRQASIVYASINSEAFFAWKEKHQP